MTKEEEGMESNLYKIKSTSSTKVLTIFVGEVKILKGKPIAFGMGVRTTAKTSKVQNKAK